MLVDVFENLRSVILRQVAFLDEFARADALHQPRNAAHSGVGIPGDAGDGADDSEVFNDTRAEPKQAVAAGIVLFDCHIADGMAAAVKNPGELRIPEPDGNPPEPRQVHVRRQAHGHIRSPRQLPVVDSESERCQFFRQTDFQVDGFAGAGLADLRYRKHGTASFPTRHKAAIVVWVPIRQKAMAF